MNIRLNLFITELILFAATLIFGIYTAYRYTFGLPSYNVAQPITFTWTDFLSLIVFLVLIFFLMRYRSVAKVSFKAFLILVVFAGTQIIMAAFLSPLWALGMALFITLCFIMLKSVVFHDIGVMLGIAGVGSVFGLSITPKIGIILLIALSFYDIIAVYATKHMVALAKNMLEYGAVFGFIIPFGLKEFFAHKGQAQTQVGERFMILGSGDIGLPLIFVASLVRVSVFAAAVTAAFSILGLFLTHLLFVNQTPRRPMAALPPIATMAIIGYLVASIMF